MLREFGKHLQALVFLFLTLHGSPFCRLFSLKHISSPAALVSLPESTNRPGSAFP
jgi:hypothetical protein